MRIVVVGGTGRVGAKVLRVLRLRGIEAVAAAPSHGVDTFTGAGLAEVLDGASTVVDASNAPSFDDDSVMGFFRTSTRNLLAAGAQAGVAHHVALSIVGANGLAAGGYFRAKVAQEQLVERASIPFTILRTTQFFEFIETIAHGATSGDTIRVPPVAIRPVAADDVAVALASVATGAPTNGIVELAGPEELPLDQLVRAWLEARDDPRKLVVDPTARYFGAPLSSRSLVPSGDAVHGTTRLEDWLAHGSDRDASAPT